MAAPLRSPRQGQQPELSQSLLPPPGSAAAAPWTDDETSEEEDVDLIPTSHRDRGHVVTSPRRPRDATTGGGPGLGASPSMSGDPAAVAKSQTATVIDLSGTQGGSGAGVTSASFGGGAGGGAGSSKNVAEQAVNLVRGHAQSVAQWITAGSFLQTYMTKEAKLMTMIVLVATLTLMAMALAVVIKSYTRLREFSVTDSSVCFGTPFEEIKTNSVGYNMANIVVGCVFALWLMVRAVRLEKGALLVCVVVVIITVVARAWYFSFAVAHKFLDDQYTLASKVVFPTAATVLLLAVPLSFRVSAGFGWRHFTKGVTQAEDVEAMQQYKRLDACAKLDLYITLTAFIALFFFVSDNFLRIYGFIVAAITVIFLVFLNVIVKRRRYWALYAFYFCCVLMPVFYVYTLTTVVVRGDSACPEDLQNCFTDHAQVEVKHCGPDNRDRCIVPFECLKQPNVTIQSACNTTAFAKKRICCSEYGRCKQKISFFDADKPLILFLAVVGCLVRVLTVYVGYRQAQAMDVPGVQEMLRRGERNLKAFSLVTLFTTGSFTQAKGGSKSSGGGGGGGGNEAPVQMQPINAEDGAAASASSPQQQEERDGELL